MPSSRLDLQCNSQTSHPKSGQPTASYLMNHTLSIWGYTSVSRRRRSTITVSMAMCTHPRGPDPSALWTLLIAFLPTASAIAGNWEPLFSRWISPQQRGFLPGRSILANVVDVEEAALQSAMTHDMPATFLFDFSAAFPSVNQDCFLRALSHIGLPLPALHAVRALYDNNRCRPAFAGALWGGFDIVLRNQTGMPFIPAALRSNSGSFCSASTASSTGPSRPRIR